MTCARDLAVFTFPPAPALRERVARVEKLNPSNALQQKPGSPQAESQDRACDDERPRASRFDTGGRGPLWTGSRLQPAFVAQVLGQVLAGADLLTARGYRRDGIALGLLVDQKA
jgi:hypothetical protein